MAAATTSQAVGAPDALRRAGESDPLDAILPFDRRDQLAELLTDHDVTTLKHLAREGMGDTLRALASDVQMPARRIRALDSKVQTGPLNNGHSLHCGRWEGSTAGLKLDTILRDAQC